MQCYTELLPPTAVTHAIALPLLGPETAELVVAKTSLLQVFRVERSQADGGERLALVGEYPLSGTVTSIARVRTLDTKTGGQALLLAFKDAKLSLVEWDPHSHRIGTISIHYYEAENVSTQPFGPSLGECESILTVDPQSRCAALKFGARQLAILPFRQAGDELVGEEEDGMDTEPASATLKRRESEYLKDEMEQTPYKASFILPLTTLDPSLSHTVHLAFLHEYREPTFGILSSQVEPSNTLLDERKDTLSYTVCTLDLEQKASTNLITVPKLPATLWKVVPLDQPIGGALLLGTNELVHIDQSGKANATAVNEFAKLESDFGMIDQSHLNMKLENCSIEVLDKSTGEYLLILSDGSLAMLSFQISGRSISAIDVTRVSDDNGNAVVQAAPSSIAAIGSNQIFVGSEDGASVLLNWTRPNFNMGRKRSHAQMLGKHADEEDEDEMEEDDDDLYDAAPETKKRAFTHSGAAAAAAQPSFTVKDTLRSIGPINDICLGRSADARKDMLQLLAGTGRNGNSYVTCINRDIVPRHIRNSKVAGAKRAWAIRATETPVPESDTGPDNLLFVFDGKDVRPYGISTAAIDVDGYSDYEVGDLETEGETLDVQTLAGGSIVVHCRRSEVRSYDSSLGLLGIIPMLDEETDQEFNIVHTSFCDPYLLVIRDDSSVQVIHVQGKEIEPIEELGPILAEKKWLSGCVYKGSLTNDQPTLFLLSTQGSFQAFDLPSLDPIYTVSTLPQLPPVFSADAAQRRAGIKESLMELLVADLGQEGVTRPYVMLRTATDDVVLYEPFVFPQSSSEGKWYSGLRFRKVPLLYIPKFNETVSRNDNPQSASLRPVRIGTYRAVTVDGAPPCLLLKEPASLPRILEVRQSENLSRVTTLLPLNRPGCELGFAAVVKDGELQESQLPPDTCYGTGWSVRQLDLGAGEVRQLAYHESRGMYVVATCRNVDFYFAEEDGRHPEQDDISLRPRVPQYSVHLVSSQSHTVLHTYEMPYLETITSLKVMPLEVSENTHKQELRVVVASAAQRGEDMPAKGAVTVFDVLEVVPEPDVPESGFKLHVVAREEARGAITTLAPFPGGFVGTAQGQKIMIRGLKEDGTCLPVAFLDAQCHTSTMKTLGSRGMWLVGDAWKGLWFGGFTEEPYKLTVLGKSPSTRMEIVAAEFIPFDESLYILVIDTDMDLHALQFDPENPKSLNGLRLLHRSTFHIGHFATTMTLLPSTLAPFAQQAINGTNGDADKVPPSLNHILTTSLTGSIGLITPLDEAAYRRLSSLQTHLTSILEHAAGLNPRAYRAVGSEGLGVVDGSLVRRIGELGTARKADVLGRVGADEWTLRSDLEIVGGGGLGYL